jgi:hypothetical protein
MTGAREKKREKGQRNRHRRWVERPAAAPCRVLRRASLSDPPAISRTHMLLALSTTED